MQSRLVAVAVLLSLASAAWGQATRAEGSDADAAMERAKRAAAGPLKAIQQAAKIRRRGDADTLPAPATVLAASAGVVPVATAPAAPERTVERVVPPAAALVLGSASLAAEVVAVERITSDSAAAAALPVLAVAQPLLNTLPVQPRAVSMPEPNIPDRVMEQGPRRAEVDAELSLRADGSVAAVALLPPVPRAWQRYITAALEQWRYEPMDGPRTYRIRLLFNRTAEP